MKRYVREQGSLEVEQLFSTAADVFTSDLTWLEVFSALHRRRRMTSITGSELARATARFSVDWWQVHPIPVTFPLLLTSRRLLERHPLKTGDAIQLASALRLLPVADLTFWCADHQLRTAAEREGLVVE